MPGGRQCSVSLPTLPTSDDHVIDFSGQRIICRAEPLFVRLFPPAFSRPGTSGRNILSRQSSFELLQSITATRCKASQPHLGIPLVPRVKQTDAFILPLSKDDPQPLSEGASKEDFAAEEPLDDYIEPESPLPDDLVDLPAAGSEVALLSPTTFFAVTCSQA